MKSDCTKDPAELDRAELRGRGSPFLRQLRRLPDRHNPTLEELSSVHAPVDV